MEVIPLTKWYAVPTPRLAQKANLYQGATSKEYHQEDINDDSHLHGSASSCGHDGKRRPHFPRSETFDKTIRLNKSLSEAHMGIHCLRRISGRIGERNQAQSGVFQPEYERPCSSSVLDLRQTKLSPRRNEEVQLEACKISKANSGNSMEHTGGEVSKYRAT
ncbi:hypothetical protein RvY_10477 [Ramazzottius varieornatus]|uniref:Uncharacterized protein n=1 Tax=Ramazzottius varieornatus TaxID=947166 RepID=A0A1D1VLW1_RAMVA|nr:hypothetical protein RvY_10477 [Ramazzottius varieornatus]